MERKMLQTAYVQVSLHGICEIALKNGRSLVYMVTVYE